MPSSKPVTNWYYAGADGKILRNGWYELGGKYYYFYEWGNSPRKMFFNLEDKRYYVDEEGARKTFSTVFWFMAVMMTVFSALVFFNARESLIPTGIMSRKMVPS